MQGVRYGVAKEFMKKSLVLYTTLLWRIHQLASSDAMRCTKMMRSAIETAHEITKLVKFSLRHEEIFNTLKLAYSECHGPGLCVLHPTRWTVSAQFLASICSN